MKIAELRERSTPDLQQLQSELARDLWKARFGNYTNQLDDTAKIRRTRRTIAQINTLITERALGLQRVSKVTEGKADREASTEDAPKKKGRGKKAELEEDVETAGEIADDAAHAADEAGAAAEKAKPKKKAATKAKEKAPAKKATSTLR